MNKRGNKLFVFIVALLVMVTVSMTVMRAGIYGGYGGNGALMGSVMFFHFFTNILTVIAPMIIIMSIVKKKRTVAASEEESDRQMQNILDRTEQISRSIKTRDPLFSELAFLAFVKKVYMDVQDAWERRSASAVKEVLHENLYQQLDRQIQENIENGIVDHLEQISVTNAYLTGYTHEPLYEYLTVFLEAGMIEYQTKGSFGRLLSGSTTDRKLVKYKMIFMRSVGSKTEGAKEDGKRGVCPNCGAPLGESTANKCEYCGSIISEKRHGWVLSELETF